MLTLPSHYGKAWFFRVFGCGWSLSRLPEKSTFSMWNRSKKHVGQAQLRVDRKRLRYRDPSPARGVPFPSGEPFPWTGTGRESLRGVAGARLRPDAVPCPPDEFFGQGRPAVGVQRGDRRTSPKMRMAWRARQGLHPVGHFSLKRKAFQTIRPVVSRKKTRFSVHFWPGGAVPPPRIVPFSKAKCSRENRHDRICIGY